MASHAASRAGATTARSVQVAGPGQALTLVDRNIPSPQQGQVRLRIQACGVCHSDSFSKEGHRPGISYPIVPGHEIVGLIDELGEGVLNFKQGQRVGVGWYGGHCRMCEPCRRGDLIHCERASIPGVTYDGGYADYMIAPQEALVAVPEELSSADAAPLLCAGITTFNALRNSQAKPGDLVAILGIGGLGHLAVQFAAKMGFRTVAVARGQDKQQAAKDLGAHDYIDSTTQDVAKTLQSLGGAKVILATVTNSDAMNEAIGGLGYAGTLVVVGVSMDPVKITPMQLITSGQSVKGWASGASIDSEDTLRFSAITGVRAQIERFPLEKAAEAYDRMMSGKARFRIVLETGA